MTSVYTGGVKYIDWDPAKNLWLREKRGIGFDEIVVALNEGGLIERRNHVNRRKYPTQYELIVLIKDYVYVVPFVEDEEKVFFKTVYPSRVETKKYLDLLHKTTDI